MSVLPTVYQALLSTPCTVTRYSAGTTDGRGDTPLVGTTTATVCSLQQRQAVEAVDGNDVQTTQWAIFLPADCADLSGQDDFQIDGYQYELVGDASPVLDPRRGTVHHVEGRVRRVF
jgi:hypothetical protein